MTQNSTEVFVEENFLPQPIHVASNAEVIDLDTGIFRFHSAVVMLVNSPDFPSESIYIDNPTQFSDSLDLDSNSTALQVFSDPAEPSGISQQTVQDLFRSIVYLNTAVEPSPDTRFVKFVVYDNTSSGLRASDPSYTELTIQLTDDAPVVQFNRISVMYTEGDAAVQLSPDLTISDVDSSQLRRAVVSFSNGKDLGLNYTVEFLMVLEEIAQMSNLTVNFSTLSGSLEVTGVSSIEMYQTLLRTLTYVNQIAAGDPITADREVSIFVEGVESNSTSQIDIVTIFFQSIDNEPLVDLNGLNGQGRDFVTVFVEEGPAVYVVSRDMILRDIDSANLEYVSVVVENEPDMENAQLDFSNSSLLSVQRVNDSIQIIGPGPVQQFLDVLLSVRYDNTADEPSPDDRTIRFNVSDGTNVVTRFTTVQISFRNDRPLVDLNGQGAGVDFQTSFVEGGVPVSVSSALNVSDDGFAIQELRIAVSPPEMLTLLGINESLYNEQTASYIYRFNPHVSVEHVQEFLRMLQYFNPLEEPQTGIRTFCISVVDTDGAVSNMACSHVTVESINDNPPSFTEATYVRNATENARDAVVIDFRLLVSDLDSQNSNTTFSFSIVDGDCTNETQVYEQCPFLLEDARGRLITNSDYPPDYEVKSEYEFTVEVNDGELNSVANILINIVDVDDNAPVFVRPAYHFNIPQGLQASGVIGTIVATDADSGINANITYLCQHGAPINSCDLFQVNPMSGDISLVQDEDMLDPTISQYVLYVEAVSGVSARRDSAVVFLNVSINENDPIFLNRSYSVDVEETISLGSVVLIVSALDSDEGSHGVVRYAIVNDTNVPFAVDEVSGNITVSAPLDYELGSRAFYFTITAQDAGRPMRSQSVNVSIVVININEFPPLFDTAGVYSANVCEGVMNNVSLLQLNATDQDAGAFGRVRYFTQSTSDAFSVDSETGIVTLVTALDYEQMQQIDVTVEARDGGNLSSFRNVTVYVLNVNDEPLSFPSSQYSVIVSEYTAVHTAVHIFDYPAVEGDLCDMNQCENGIALVNIPSCTSAVPRLQYTQSTLDVPFIVNPDTGIIYLNEVLDFETAMQKNFTFVVTVSDGESEDTATINIQLGDHNEFPPILDSAFYNASILENVQNGSHVITIVATDQDAGQSGVITYSLLGPNSNHFFIDPSGRVLTSAVLDRENVSFYNLTVVAKNIGADSLSAEASLIINVFDVNDMSPGFNATGYQFMVLENTPEGENVGQVFAVDMDEGQSGQVTYSLLGSDSRYFVVHPSSGVVVTNETFDREEDDLYTFYVVAMDQGLPVQSAVVQVNVTILDEDDNPPSFSQVSYNISVHENEPVNQSLVTFLVSDPDEGRNADFLLQILNGNEDGHFHLTAETGILRVASMLDFENIQSYMVYISASSVVNTLQQATAVVTVNVLDVNDNPPVFTTNHNVSIPEHSAVGSLVVLLNAIDIDSGINAAVAYSIQSVVPLQLSPAFAINSTSGEIRVANQKLIDRETTSHIVLSVLAFNPYFLLDDNATASFTVILTDVNDHAPTFDRTSYAFIVDEDFTPVGDNISRVDDLRLIGSVVASDDDDPEVDGNGAVKYKIVGGNEAGLFTVNATSGNVSAVQLLDREASAEHNLVIAAYDCNPAYPLNSTVNVQIILLDINDNEPIFTVSFVNLSISEAANIGTPVTTISAVDSDEAPNANIEYTLVDDAFTINPTSGMISVASLLDRETTAEHLLTVMASDGTFPTTAEVLISLTDVNDNVPILSPLSIRLELPEDTPVGSVVFSFNLTDADAGNNSMSDLIFFGDSNGFVALGNGSLIILQALNYEVAPNILNLEMFARNTLPPHFSSRIARVEIVTLNVNDVAPQLTLSRTVVDMLEDERAVTLNAQAMISDGDGVNISSIVSFKVMVISELAPQESSTPFTPSTNDLPYTCLESKERKLVGCCFGAEFNFDYTVLLDDVILMNQATLLQGRVLVLDGVNQYARFDNSRVTSLTPSGGAISVFLWKLPHPTTRTIPMTIISKTTASTVHYTLACDADNALVFNYLGADSGILEHVDFPGICEQLEGSWHHLTLVVLPPGSSNQWRVNVMIDAVLQKSMSIQEPMDNLLATAYIGALELRGNAPEQFFPGRISDLFISKGPVTMYEVSCIIGCGVAIKSSTFPPSLDYYFNYSSRALSVEHAGTSEEYIAFINSLVFVQPFVEPLTSPYVLEYSVNDGKFDSTPVQQEVNILAFNNHQPVISTNGGNVYETVFTEEGSPVPAVNISALILEDDDLVAFSYTIIVSIIDVPENTAEDMLNVSGVPSGMTLMSTASELSLSGFFPIAEFRAVLSTLTYANIEDNPTGSRRVLVLTVNDSLFISPPSQTIINFHFINDPPSVAFTPSMMEFTENTGPLQVFSAVVVSDEDNQYLAGAVLSLMAFDGELEVLSVSDQISNTSVIAKYNFTTNTLTLVGNDTLQAYSAILSTLTYDHLTEMGSPTTGTRTLTVTVSDGTDGSAPAEVIIPFKAVNDPPIVYLGGSVQNHSVTFLEDVTSGIAITANSVNIVDVDNSSLVDVVVTLLNPLDELEFLEASGSGNIIVVQESLIGLSLTLVPNNSLQAAPISDFVAALATVLYVNTEEEPTSDQRMVEVIANDGLVQSTPSFVVVNIVTQNDAPSLDLNGPLAGTGFETLFTEESEEQNITSPQVTIMDNDQNFTITKVYITIHNAIDGLSEVVSSSVFSSIIPPPTVNNVTSTNQFVINVPPSMSSPQTAVDILKSLVYRNLKLEPTAGERQIELSVSDGEDVSDAAITVLGVVTINDNKPMFIELSMVSTIAENGATGDMVSTVFAMDADSGEDGDVEYKIVGGDSHGQFQIDTQTGDITTVSALDREMGSMYTLEVVATDRGAPTMTSAVNAIVEVYVLDINDVTPTIVTPPQLNVSEGAVIGTTVDTLMTMDNDLGMNGTIVYSVVEGDNSPFNVSTEDGRIIVSGVLDADTQEGVAVFTLTIMVEDLGTPPLSSEQQFTITVTNENEFAPVLEPREDNVIVPESLPVNGSILNVSAVDGDTGPNGDVWFLFADPLLYNTFALDSVTGEIRTVVVLDHESQQSYRVVILAVDQGVNPRTASSVINITVEDVNDNHPEFVGVPTAVNVSENSPPETLVLQISAVDRDTGNNSRVTFSFASVTTEFAIDPFTGDITVLQPLDFELTKVLRLVVRALDHGEPPLSSTTEVVINVLDVNDNAPQFVQEIFSIQVLENQSGNLLLNLTATDADSGTNALLEFYLIDDYSGAFFVNNMGQLDVRVALDFELQCQYNLTVVARDKGEPPLMDSAQVLVSVVNVEDVPPTFNRTMYLFPVPENEPPGWEVGQVMAFDGDGSNCSSPQSSTVEVMLVYSIINNTGYFAINETTGIISTSVTLDREETSMYNLVVEVRDHEGLGARVFVRIVVQDRNDLPPVFSPSQYAENIPESTTTGAIVLQLSAVDGDLLDEGQLRFTLEEVPSLPFNVSSTGSVRVSGPLDFDSQDSFIYNFSAFVTDGVGNMDTAQVIITVSDSNDSPPSVSEIQLNQLFTEGDAPLYLYENLTITDDDANHQTLHGANIELFAPEDNTEDGCQCATSCTNACLEFLQLNQSLFPGQTEVGFRTITLSGVYSISVYVMALRTVQYVNNFTNPNPRNRSVSLAVSDGASSSTPVVVTISLAVFNQFAPVLDANGFNQPGSSFVTNFTEEGTPVQIVSNAAVLSDNDSLTLIAALTSLTVQLENPLDGNFESLMFLPAPLPEGITCSLHSGYHMGTCTGSASHASYMSVLSQIRYANTALEPDSTPRSILLTVTEYHLGSTSRTTVNIVTINDHHPRFSYLGQGSDSFTTYMEESAGVPVLGPTGQIVDEDSGNDAYANNVWVELLSPTASDRIFIQDPSLISPLVTIQRVKPTMLLFSGVASIIDYEYILRQTMYRSVLIEFDDLVNKDVQLCISDVSSRQCSVTTISLLPVNDNLPVFQQSEYTFDVAESAVIGQVIGAVSATDNDTIFVPSTVYSIVGSSTVAEIAPDTGTLTLKEQLDYEAATQHAVYVQALDTAYTGSLPPNQVKVVLEVQDVNDNPPVFVQTVYNSTVEEGAPLDTIIETVSATDADGPLHSIVTYELLGSNDFKIHTSFGVISTNGVIDHETQNMYNVTVVASNPGSNISNSATVTIIVLDVDDNVPIIILSPRSKNITEIPNSLQLATSLAVELAIHDPDHNPSLVSANVSIAPSYAGTGVLVSAGSNGGISTFGNGTRSVHFEGLRSVVTYQQILREVHFYDANEEPMPGTIRIQYQVFTARTSSLSAAFTLTVQVVNDNAPALILDVRDMDNSTLSGFGQINNSDFTIVQTEGAYFTMFIEDGPSVPVSDQSLIITDMDSGTNIIAYAIVNITDAQDAGQEELTVELSQGVVLASDSNTVRLNLLGPVSLNAMAAVLRTIK